MDGLVFPDRAGNTVFNLAFSAGAAYGAGVLVLPVLACVLPRLRGDAGGGRSASGAVAPVAVLSPGGAFYSGVGDCLSVQPDNLAPAGQAWLGAALQRPVAAGASDVLVLNCTVRNVLWFGFRYPL